MKNAIVIFCSLFLLNSSFAQDEYVVDEPRACIYPSFDHFSKGECWRMTTTKGTGKRFSVVDPAGAGVVLEQDEVWGKVDNGDTYIHYDKVFSKLENTGRFRYFIHEQRDRVHKIDPVRLSVRIDATPDSYPMLLDTINGNVAELNRKLMRILLEPYPDLLDEYNRTRKKELDEHLNFIERLNALEKNK